MSRFPNISYARENGGVVSNQRRFKRYAFFSQVRLYTPEFERLDFARCTNLGQGGMKFSTKLQTLIEGSQVVIEVRGMDKPEVLTLLAEVRYCVPESDSTHQCGVAFLSMNEDLQGHIQNLVNGCPEV